MGIVDYSILALVVLIVAAAGYFIYRAKKSGKKCIGCPHSGTCSGNCSGCGGNCSGCGGK